MLNKVKKSKSEGFTIIEVLIVLAIAGLVMLIVFLAVPALQRNSRNTSRSNDASRIAAAVSECMSSRNNTVTSCDAPNDYNVGTLSQLTLPGGATAGTSTSAVAATAPTTASSTTVANVWFGRVCIADGSASTATGANPREFVVLYTAEPATTRCISS